MAAAFRVDGSILPRCCPFPDCLAALQGWRRRGVLMVLGALAALALPPVGWFPVLFVSLPGLVWAWAGARSYKDAFLTVWWWGLGFYAVGFYWIAFAMLVDAASFAWMIPFATLGLGGVVAVFPALGLTAAFALRGKGGPSQAVWIAIFWTVGEWARSFVLTGFPWNPLGSVWDVCLPVLQAGSLFGVHGLSFITMLCFALLAMLPTIAQPSLRAVVIACALGIPATLGVWGEIRLAGAPTEFVPGVKLRLVQPNSSLAQKWLPQNREPALRTMVDLSRRDGFQDLSLVIWPESSAPFDLVNDQIHRRIAGQAAPPHGLVLAGAPRLKAKEGGGWQFWNSLTAIDENGQVQAVYDKAHLVPFGEYVPFRGKIPLQRVASTMGDFSAGPGPRTVELPGFPSVAPAICYESIFPGEVVSRTDPRPQWLVVITNDGWFGISAGPYQHFAAGRMRAIEEGLPMARAANTGISGVVDAYGRVLTILELGQQGIVDSALPMATPDTTPYGRWANYTVFVLLITAALIALGTTRYN